MAEEAGDRGFLPIEVELREPTGNPDEIGAAAERLVGDLEVAALRVVGLRPVRHSNRVGYVPVAGDGAAASDFACRSRK